MQAADAKRASPDYERPGENVAEIPDPVTLPAIKARQGETSGHMRWVLCGRTHARDRAAWRSATSSSNSPATRRDCRSAGCRRYVRRRADEPDPPSWN